MDKKLRKIKWYMVPVYVIIGQWVISAVERRERIKRKAKDGTLSIWDLL